MFEDRKGSFTIDTFFALLLLIATSTALLNVAQETQAVTEKTVKIQREDLVTEKLAAAINAVYSNGPSLQIFVGLPDNINGENYTIYSVPENRILSIDGSEPYVEAHIIPGNVESFSLDSVSTGRIHIYWENEEIKVEKV